MKWVVGRGWVRWLGSVWVVAEVGCWSSEITSVWVRRGHGVIGVGLVEIDVGHHMVGWFFWVLLFQ